MTPTPNTPLTAEDVTLLKAGDVLRAVESTVSFSVGEIVTVEGIEDWGNTSEINVFGLSWMPSRFTFIGRPGPDGWMPWTGGENPVPGQIINARLRDGTETGDIHSKGDWLHSPRRNCGYDIIAFRLAGLSPAASEDGEKCERRGNFCQRCGYRACMARPAPAASEPGGESGAVLAEINELRVLLDSLRAEDDGYCVQGDDDLPLRVLRRLFTALSSSPPAQAGAVAHAELRKAAEAAAKIAPGLWGSDIEKGEGEYGIGDNTHTGYMVPYMETEYGKRLFDAHNTDVGLIEEDYSFDENGAHHSAWDENSQVIFEYLALVQPANIIALLYAHPSGLAGAVEDLRGHSGVEKTYWHMIRMAKERGFSSVSDAIEAAGAVEVARKALERIRDGREKHLPDGTTAMVELDDAETVARDALEALAVLTGAK